MIERRRAKVALWQLGFRPFYLLASIFGATSVLLWAAQVSGLLPQAYLQGPLWHCLLYTSDAADD